MQTAQRICAALIIIVSIIISGSTNIKRRCREFLFDVEIDGQVKRVLAIVLAFGVCGVVIYIICWPIIEINP